MEPGFFFFTPLFGSAICRALLVTCTSLLLNHYFQSKYCMFFNVMIFFLVPLHSANQLTNGIVICSAPPPPLQAGTFSRGVVTMRCDLSTCSSAHISLLVSGSAQTCFNDQARINVFCNCLFLSVYLFVWSLLSSCVFLTIFLKFFLSFWRIILKMRLLRRVS